MVASKLEEESSYTALARSIPSISTKTAWDWPLLLVMVQAGPGECHPEGVGPGVNHRLATPPLTVVVIPGLKGLLLNDVVPVAPEVMSEIFTFFGVHGTREFQEPAAATLGINGPMRPIGSWESGTRRKMTTNSRMSAGKFPFNASFPGKVLSWNDCLWFFS